LKSNLAAQLLSFRVLRLQKEEEEVERKKIEAAIQREQEQQEFIKQKEREILQLQVWIARAWKPQQKLKIETAESVAHIDVFFLLLPGGCKELHHLGELGSKNRGGAGQSKKLQLCHRQRRQSCQADSAEVKQPTDPRVTVGGDAKNRGRTKILWWSGLWSQGSGLTRLSEGIFLKPECWKWLMYQKTKKHFQTCNESPGCAWTWPFNWSLFFFFFCVSRLPQLLSPQHDPLNVTGCYSICVK